MIITLPTPNSKYIYATVTTVLSKSSVTIRFAYKNASRLYCAAAPNCVPLTQSR